MVGEGAEVMEGRTQCCCDNIKDSSHTERIVDSCSTTTCDSRFMLVIGCMRAD